MDEQELRQQFAKLDVRRVKVGGFDIDGTLRGKFISLEKFWSAVQKGFGFCDVIFGWDIADALYDNATVTGWHSGYPDAHAQLDLSTLRFLPQEPHTAHVLVDFFTQEGKPHPACPRSLLKRITGQAETDGYRPRYSAEFEFWVFQETSASVHDKAFQQLDTLSRGMCGYSWVRTAEHEAFIRDLLDTLGAYDIEIEGFHTETGPGVYEAAIRYDDIVASADAAALFKTVVKNVASRHGLIATFMAKWNENLPGSSGHMHQSLWSHDGTQNLFADTAGAGGLSKLGRQFVAGQLALMPELTALCAPFVNSYKRFVPGLWAPLTASWGVENRTCAIRVIEGAEPSATRTEYRQCAADMNPYIAMATALAAGLHGIRRNLEPPAPVSGDATTADDTTATFPTSLAEATRRLHDSSRAREVLGDAFVEHYVRTRQWEVRQAERAVTDWELARYFEAV